MVEISEISLTACVRALDEKIGTLQTALQQCEDDDVHDDLLQEIWPYTKAAAELKKYIWHCCLREMADSLGKNCKKLLMN
ncbi:hypothetical protein V8J88_22090 [Massilia sp. W12]|uniref:hypothetical protein n=1 Tax=Massilia sp. W12 TaxID=3126507 RepID=UPI0030CF05E5